MNLPNNKGFSLLEAIVAMAIVAGFGMAIFAWINTNLITLTRIETKNANDQIVRSVAEFMQDIDIMAEPDGNALIGEYSIEWQAELIEPANDGVNRKGNKSEFLLGLYQTKVIVYLNEVQVAGFNVRLVGYKKVRDLLNNAI